MGLATLRPDGFVALAAAARATATTVPLAVKGALVISADMSSGGSVQVSVRHAGLPGGVAPCAPVTGRNVTSLRLTGCDLSPVMGADVVLALTITDAAAYTVGFIA